MTQNYKKDETSAEIYRVMRFNRVARRVYAISENNTLIASQLFTSGDETVTVFQGCPGETCFKRFDSQGNRVITWYK